MRREIIGLFIDMINLDFESAFKDNQFLFLTWPLIVIELVYNFLSNGTNKTAYKINNVLLIAYGILLILFGILRNVFLW